MRKTLISLVAALLTTASVAAPADPPPFVPVLTADFPDAFILRKGTEFFAYATNATAFRANVQMARSTNLADWTLDRDGDKLHDAMPVLPPWARPGFTWAPEVIRTATGYVLHFTAKDRRSGRQCLGAAFSTDPRGPFTSAATEPLVCQTELGGTIDSSPFRDTDGKMYLYYKADANAVGKPTELFVQPLSADGLSVSGAAVPLVRNDVSWEAHVIEAPTMVRHGAGYFLFYSANHYGWETHQDLSPYAMGYARCTGPTGPCTDAPENPILYSYRNRSAGCLSGPGHQSVFDVGPRQFISFHAWAATPGCRKLDDKRYLYVAPLLWDGDKPKVGVSMRPTVAK